MSEKTSRNDIVNKNDDLTIERQCELLQIAHSTFYYQPAEPTAEQIKLKEKVMERLDHWHTKSPAMGTRSLSKKLKDENLNVGRKQVKSLMAEMGIYAVYPKPNLSKRNQKQKIHPYLLRNMNISTPNKVWAVDITYIKMHRGHMYLTAIIDKVNCCEATRQGEFFEEKERVAWARRCPGVSTGR